MFWRFKVTLSGVTKKLTNENVSFSKFSDHGGPKLIEQNISVSFFVFRPNLYATL